MRDKIDIIDDLITTAKSKLETIKLIKLEAKRRNVDIIGVYVLLNREQGSNHKESCKMVARPWNFNFSKLQDYC